MWYHKAQAPRRAPGRDAGAREAERTAHELER